MPPPPQRQLSAAWLLEGLAQHAGAASRTFQPRLKLPLRREWRGNKLLPGSVAVPLPSEGLPPLPNDGLPELRARVEEAHDYFHNAYKSTLNGTRAELLARAAQLFRENAPSLALILTMESGKTLKESLVEIEYGASYFSFFAEEAKRIYGDVLPVGKLPHREITARREPLGVVGAISPFNFPNALLARKVAAALATGNCVVARPSELVPYSAIAMANVLRKAGFDRRAFQVVTSDREGGVALGREMCENEKVRKISFTGSTGVGVELLKRSAPHMKRVSLELGGNAPFIVFPDAVVDEAMIEQAFFAKFRYSGQTCVAANRFLVHESKLAEFEERFATRVASMRLGEGIYDQHCEYSSLIDVNAVRKMDSFLKRAVESGSNIRHRFTFGDDEKNYEEDDGTGCYFYPPTIVRDTAKVSNDVEIFGPIVPIVSFSTDEEAVQLANATSAGLAAYFFTNDARRIERVSSALKFGMVGVNTGAISQAEIPFGGVKASGFGREGSKYGLDDYTEIKMVAKQF